MIAFADGAADVLVCTTIIESGLDIPNANTIIIDRADTLGLAQLYQLRGRVGRLSAAGLRLPAVPPPRAAVATRRASGSRRSSTRPSSAPASRSPCPTSRSAAPATSSAASSPGTWRPSASTSTRACWPRRSRRARRRWRAARRSSRRRRPSSTCRSRRTCRPTTSPTRPRSSSSTGGWRARAHAGRPGRLPPGGPGPLRADARPRSPGWSRWPSCA